MKTFIFLLLTLSFLTSFSQRDRYRFAETYVGFETEFVSEKNHFNFYNNEGIKRKGLIPSTITPRILIGGTHFWGHADFYISIPISQIRINGNKELFSTNNVYTGFRLLPWKLKNNAVRPYVGVGFNSKKVKLENGPIYANMQWFFEGGINYRFKNRILGLEMKYFPQNEFYTAISRTEFENLSLSNYSFSLSYKIAFDGSANYSSEHAKKYTQTIYDKAQQSGALSTFSLGLGLSALIPLDETELASQKAFFNDEIESTLTLDLGVGYYSNPLDATVRVSYRPLKQEEIAFDYNYKLVKHSLALEAFKFIGDYHGFVPFIGPYVSMDHYRLKETDHGNKIIDEKSNRLGYGVVFGWDIRLTDTDYLILRTNLRYTPEMGYKSNGYKFTSEQLEFNFIQFVYYPERHKLHKQKN
jgi:hypothetical protein